MNSIIHDSVFSQLPIYLEYYKQFGLDLSLLHKLVEAIKTERAEKHEDETEEPLWVSWSVWDCLFFDSVLNVYYGVLIHPLLIGEEDVS